MRRAWPFGGFYVLLFLLWWQHKEDWTMQAETPVVVGMTVLLCLWLACVKKPWP